MPRRAQQGFALVTVLWILVVVGGLGAAFHTAARASRRAVANTHAAARARWAARAGLVRALQALDHALLEGAGGLVAPGAGRDVLPPLAFAVDDVPVTVTVQDARAQVQLNLADAAQLTRLFHTLGVPPEQAARHAAALLDWRDPDHQARPLGAERPHYAHTRPPTSPKNGAFDRVAELSTVLGVSPAEYERISPYVTVVGDGRVNVNAAPLPVLTSLPGIDAAAAAVIVSRRRTRPFRNVFELAAALPRGARDAIQADMGAFTDRVAFGPRVVEIVVTASVDGSPVGSRLWAEVELTGGAVWNLVRVVER